MVASDYIIDVSEVDFDYQVLTFSEKVPVLVDFWAEWCVPCKTLGPLLERLAIEAAGSFRLARLNVDQNPNLALRYGVRSIPTVKAFRDGKVVSEFVGLLPEPRLREFIRAVVPGPADLMLEKGNSLLELNQWKSAEAAFQDALEAAPGHPSALLGLAKSLLAQGRAAQALAILENFPPSREYSIAEVLLPLAYALQRVEMGQEISEDPLEAAYLHALRLIKRGNLPAALDGLLDILRQDKRYRNGEVHRVILGILEMMGETPLTRQYRQELAAILF